MLVLTIVCLSGLASILPIEADSSTSFSEIDIPVNLTSANEKVAFLNSSMPKFVSSASYTGVKASGRKIISVLGLINYGGTSTPAGPICSKAIELALDQLRKQPIWLPDYDLLVELVDDECDDQIGIRRALEKITSDAPTVNRIPFMLVPQCATKAQVLVAALLKPLNYIGTTVTITKAEVNQNRKLYGSFFGLGPVTTIPAWSEAAFMQLQGWRKTAIVSDLSAYFNDWDNVLIDACEKIGVEVIWWGKVAEGSTDAQEMSNAYAAMKASGARIIVHNLNAIVSGCCWLYRYGFYGPNYVIIASGWNFFNPITVKIPSYVSSWCSSAMLSEVIKSFIFYGGGLRPDVLGTSATDSTGFSMDDFSRAMRGKVFNGQQNTLWYNWPQLCYDQMLFLGYILNATEGLLRQQNETLGEWTINSPNFKSNGKRIVDLMKSVIYSTPVTGMRGEYYFDENTMTNSRGFTPVIYSRAWFQPGTSNIQRANFAYFKSNTNKFVGVGDMRVWDTKDGLPPKDSVRTIVVLTPATPISAYATLCTLGAIALLTGLLFLCFGAIKRKHPERFMRLSMLTNYDFLALAGNGVMTSHVFAIARESNPTIDKSCSAIAVLVTTGYSVLIAAYAAKLCQGKPAALSEASSPPSGRVIYRHRSSVIASFKKRLRLVLRKLPSRIFENVDSLSFCFIWIVLNVTLIVVFVSESSIESVVNILDFSDSDSDNSVVYQHIRYDCRVKFDRALPLGLIAIIAFLQAVLLLQAAFSAYQLRSLAKNGITVSDEIKQTSNFVYPMISTIVAGAVIAAMRPMDGAYTQLTLSATVLAICYLSLASMVLSKILLRTDSIEPHRGHFALNSLRLSQRKTELAAHNRHSEPPL